MKASCRVAVWLSVAFAAVQGVLLAASVVLPPLPDIFGAWTGKGPQKPWGRTARARDGRRFSIGEILITPSQVGLLNRPRSVGT